MGKLWGDKEIKVLGVSGEFSSGKTLFVCTIDPANTCLYDFEESASSYTSLGFKDRINVPEEMLKRYPKGHTGIQLWEWWIEHVRNLPAGKFTVIACDHIGELEDGLTDWVEAHPEAFGRTAKQYEKASGLLWKDMKQTWTTVLLSVANRCETFAFTSHFRNVYKNGVPTGRKEPAGKETLLKLTSLYLLLERKPDQQGNIPEAPAAVVKKHRLCAAVMVDGEPKIQQLIPPRLPVATPAAIRKYIANPPNWAKLKKDERLQPEVLTEQEKAENAMILAQLEKEKAEAELKKYELLAKGAKNVVSSAVTPEARDGLEREQDNQSHSDSVGGSQGPANEGGGNSADGVAAGHGGGQQVLNAGGNAAGSPVSSQGGPDAIGTGKDGAVLNETSKTPTAEASTGSQSQVSSVSPAAAASGDQQGQPGDAPPFDGGTQRKSIFEVIREQFTDLGIDEAGVQKILAKRGAKALHELSAEQLEEMRKNLWTKITSREMTVAGGVKK